MVENAAMRHFYNRMYETSGSKDCSFLDFFHSYYVKFLRTKALASNSRLNGFSLADFPYRNKIEKLRVLCTDLLTSRWDPLSSENNTLSLDESDLGFLKEGKSNLEYPKHSFSSSAFVQPCPDGKLVLPEGRFHIGYGKYYSRFLTLAPEVFKTELKNSLPRSTGDTIYAELRGGDYFNGNRGASIFKEVISVDRAKYPEVNMVELEDLIVKPVGQHFLGLYSRTGEVVVPIDLGFLDARQTAPIRQLLSCFCPSWSFSLPAHWPKAKLEPTTICQRPRVIFDDNLVISRKRWLVPSSQLVWQEDQRSEAELALAVQIWILENRIPSIFFAKAVPVTDLAEVSFTLKNQQVRDQMIGKWTKSHPIDLLNPSGLRRFRRLSKAITKSGNNFLLEIEEAFPLSNSKQEEWVFLLNNY